MTNCLGNRTVHTPSSQRHRTGVGGPEDAPTGAKGEWKVFEVEGCGVLWSQVEEIGVIVE
ncbi:hypothetical protein FM114_15930 [Luteococcus japonicus LSP_Lj1]|uniref:Uncharacterized protein n=1 Tax=Luteococcus japonicus LSP_Lj1 TaxID=1255658 RepID=A0A1R4KM06_9ACTN|nr:hypothetical protein FM114_15930 [Luteococcus japonicus LSP_Lj1]